MSRVYRGQRYVIVYNGEIYNTRELRQELESRGHTFRGYCDTEVVLAAYMEWGVDCPKQLNGSFAFAVWNQTRRNLFLARDRVGLRPLFYMERPSGLLFGSQLKTLLAHPEVKPELSADGLAEIFVTGPMRTPGHGVFHNIKELRAGHSLFYNRSMLYTRQYWNLVSYPHSDDLDTTVHRVRELVRDAVVCRTRADVPVAALLSGGLDSSVVTGHAASSLREQGKVLHTYSIDYEGNDLHFQATDFQPNTDSDYASDVADYFETVHHTVVLSTENLFGALDAAVRARDLPGMADVDSSLLLFSEEISRDHTVILSGEAADEVFGGYPWLFSEEALEADMFPWVRMVELRSRLLHPDIARLLNPEEYMLERYREALAEVPRLEGEPGRAARLREVFYLNLSRFGGTLLERKDRMTAGAGLEARVPYCDHRLIDYIWNIPWEMKTVDDREKGLLRRAVADLLPQVIVERRKSPYPKTHNPAYLGLVRDRIAQVLDDPNSPLVDLVDTNEVRRIANNAESIDLPFFGQLMTGPQLLAYLLQVDTWLREYGVRVVV